MRLRIKGQKNYKCHANTDQLKVVCLDYYKTKQTLRQEALLDRHKEGHFMMIKE